MQVYRRGGGTLLLNVIKAEKYLASVIGSEMHPSAPKELLKAHAIIARSWLMQHLGAKPHVHPALSGQASDKNRIVSWTDTTAHNDYDVCNTDHCQRYQGLDAVTQNSTEAVLSTRGMVLKDIDGNIADTRYSKCCGGHTEVFSTCWEDISFPYLTDKDDPYCHPDRFKEALARHPYLLKDFDLATDDYYIWHKEVPKELIRSNLKHQLGIEIGEITNLRPLKSGKSGRIYELEICSKDTSVIIGKELIIRRILSTSHLYSSAFTIAATPTGFMLRGKGWGHGVGLCQIGAAVMASEGHSCADILDFYFPGTSIETIY